MLSRRRLASNDARRYGRYRVLVPFTLPRSGFVLRPTPGVACSGMGAAGLADHHLLRGVCANCANCAKHRPTLMAGRRPGRDPHLLVAAAAMKAGWAM